MFSLIKIIPIDMTKDKKYSEVARHNCCLLTFNAHLDFYAVLNIQCIKLVLNFIYPSEVLWRLALRSLIPET